jgi:hypothetical protein
MDLRYLYVGSTDTGADLTAWMALPGASLRWRFRHFGADVAAVDLGLPPVILIADHRSNGSILPIYAVESLETAIAALERAGWSVDERSFGTPEGPAALLTIAHGGAQLALLQVDRPRAMDEAYLDEANTHAVHNGAAEHD